MAGLAWAELGDDILVRQYILDRSVANKPHDIEPHTSTTLTVALLYLMCRTAKGTASIAPRVRVRGFGDGGDGRVACPCLPPLLAFCRLPPFPLPPFKAP